MTWQLFCFGFFAGSAYATITIFIIKRRRDRKPKQPNHFHSIGFGVSAPCDDERCPEWRADR